jgi:hypothetical protein
VYGGDGGCGLGSLPPTFTLLSDGELFFDGWNDELKAYKLQTTKLSRQGTCNLLNSIDQAGFFDYDPSTYVNDPQNWIPPVMGAGRTYISVQAWRSNSISLYDLDDFINNVDEIKTNWGCGDCPNLEFPTILPSLRKTYQLLLSYQPANLEIYQSDRLGIWIDANGETDNAVAWPLKSIKLSEIVFQTSNTSNRPDIILSGENAAIVYQLFIQNSGFCDASVTEGDKVYRLFARHLLPYEYQSNTPVPKTLSCSPADGWIEVP